jgi:hypothetical protein
MPTHLKALLVILALAAAVFAFAKIPAGAVTSAAGDFERRRNLWFAITLTAFLAHNFWIYIVITAALIIVTLPREPNKLALYLFLLLVVPPFGQEITGLGIIQNFFRIDYLRLLALTILLPAFFFLRQQADSIPFGRSHADKFIAGYLILNFGLVLMASSFTNTLRQGGFYAFTDIFLPYYVASRWVRSVRDFHDSLMAFVLAAIVMGVIGVFETGRHWLLYAALPDAQGLDWTYSSYLERSGVGLRAQGTTGQPIVLGFVMAVAFGFFISLRKTVASTWVARVVSTALFAGLIAPFSRGPWVGAAVMLLVFVATGPSAGKYLLKSSLIGAVVFVVILATPFRDQLIALLPLEGTEGGEAAANVVYRQQLLSFGTQAVLQNPFFGAYDVFLAEGADSLKQGNGMIDLVNTYLAIALGKGLVGLALFLGFFIATAASIFNGMRSLPDKDSELHRLGQVLFSTLIGILVIIFTTSSILVISVITWSVAGLGIGYAQMIRRGNVSAKERDTGELNGLRPATINCGT